MDFSPDGKMIISGSNSSIIILWQLCEDINCKSCDEDQYCDECIDEYYLNDNSGKCQFCNGDIKEWYDDGFKF